MPSLYSLNLKNRKINIIFNRNLIVTHQAGHESYDQNLIFTPAKYFCFSDSFGTNLFLAVNVLNSFDHDFINIVHMTLFYKQKKAMKAEICRKHPWSFICWIRHFKFKRTHFAYGHFLQNWTSYNVTTMLDYNSWHFYIISLQKYLK